MRSLRCFATCLLIVFSLSAPGVAQEAEEQGHSHSGSEEGLGRVHMDISCPSAVGAKFDRALALLHNFWYRRALEGFQQVSNVDPECAIAYWGAAMTYNHPFWDAPSSADETAAWGLVQKGFAAKKYRRARSSISTQSPLSSRMLERDRKPRGTKATAMPWPQPMLAFPTMRPSSSTALRLWDNQRRYEGFRSSDPGSPALRGGLRPQSEPSRRAALSDPCV